MVVGIRDMEEGDILGEKTMEATSILKESKESLVEVVGRDIKKKTLNGSIMQLFVHLSK